MSKRPFSMVPLPTNRSMEKPREKGLSMMMDWGLPVGELEDRLGMIAPYVDFAKFVVGTARLYDEEYLQRKLEIYHAHRVHPFIGGQFLEYVYATQGFDGVQPYCEEAHRLGFKAIEVSDNCVPLSENDRKRLIRSAIDCGLEVHGEVGSKSDDTSASTLIAQANACYEAGADVVLVEGAELIENGEPKADLLRELKAGLDLSKVMFELSGHWIPGTTNTEIYQLKKFFITEFGPDVNMANIMPQDIWETEALRCGLSVVGPTNVR